jgi:hypothetical protein
LSEFKRDLIILTQKINIPILLGGKLVRVLTDAPPTGVLVAAGDGQQDIIALCVTLFGDESPAEEEVLV